MWWNYDWRTIKAKKIFGAKNLIILSHFLILCHSSCISSSPSSHIFATPRHMLPPLYSNLGTQNAMRKNRRNKKCLYCGAAIAAGLAGPCRSRSSSPCRSSPARTPGWGAKNQDQSQSHLQARRQASTPFPSLEPDEVFHSESAQKHCIGWPALPRYAASPTETS